MFSQILRQISHGELVRTEVRDHGLLDFTQHAVVDPQQLQHVDDFAFHMGAFLQIRTACSFIVKPVRILRRCERPSQDVEVMNKNMLYRSIPKVDVLLEDPEIQGLIETYSRDTVVESIHLEMDALRKYIGTCEDEEKAKEQIGNLNMNVRRTVTAMHTPNMRSVINGTGTILHTNLGRAPISQKHMNRIAQIATGYSNLEYNLEAGRRGERYSHFEKLLCKITGAEAAMAVNNNAAAVMLILSSLAKGGEVVVSRGELIEIGGKFRIPDVMEQSGANLVEVGTTNKTHYEDYEEAITEETKALLKVHTSNYRIVGFTDTVGIDELIPIAKEHDIPVIEDLGSGVLIDLSKYGITYEPTVQDSIRKGADVVCFSGDKLL